jgi:hypothetical protein
LLCHQFIFNNKNIYLFELLTNNLNVDKLDNIINVFKLQQFYSNLQYVIKKNGREILFTEKEHIYKLPQLISDNFTSNLLNKIDDIISNIYNYETQINLVNQVVQFIKFAITYTDVGLFTLLYRNKLTQRLNRNKCFPTTELEFLKLIPYKYSKDLYTKMIFQIQDLISSQNNLNIYKCVDFELNSPIYKLHGITTKDINRNKFNFIVKSSYAWDLTTTRQMNIPIEIMPYVDIYTKLYNAKYPDRELTYDYDTSIANIFLTLKNNIKYELEVTISQLCVIFLLNHYGSMTAKDLGIKLNVTNRQLSSLINSFLTFDLITKTSGLINDVTISLSINNNCILDSKSLSLVNTYHNFLLNKPKEDNKLSDIPDSILQIELIAQLIKLKKCTEKILCDELNKKFNKNINHERILLNLNYLINKKDVQCIDDIYSYNMKNTFDEIGDDLDSIN